MIVAFSTSSPMASTALLSDVGEVIGASSRLAPMAASGACLEMLGSLLASFGSRSEGLAQVSGFVADLGPGSFSGVKVGVTLAKTLALVRGVRCAGVASFDLVDPVSIVAIPVRKAECLVRIPGKEPFLGVPPNGAKGYGVHFDNQNFPLAERFAASVLNLEWAAPEALVPAYLLEPSISTPKKPFREAGSG